MKGKGFNILAKHKKKKTSSQSKYPHWIDQDNKMLVAFYERATEIFESIKSKIDDGIELSVKERQIVKSAVADYCGYDKSNMRKGRPAEKVSDYIDELNEDLKRIWGKRNPVKRKNPEKLLRSELEIQNKALKKECKELTTAAYRDYFDGWLDMYANKDTQRMQARIIDLEAQNRKLSEENLKLGSELKAIKRKSFKVVKS